VIGTTPPGRSSFSPRDHRSGGAGHSIRTPAGIVTSPASGLLPGRPAMYPAAPRGHYPDPQEVQMYTTFNAARTRAHHSRHERQRLARTLAFSRRTPPVPPPAPMVELQRAELELIERLVHRDRTAVSSALLLSPASAPAAHAGTRCSPESARWHGRHRRRARSAASAARRSPGTSTPRWRQARRGSPSRLDARSHEDRLDTRGRRQPNRRGGPSLRGSVA
jgi:hypothetical protein